MDLNNPQARNKHSEYSEAENISSGTSFPCSPLSSTYTSYAYDWKPKVQKIVIGSLEGIDFAAMVLFAGVLKWI
jgi:hypothetical protein